MLTEQKRYPALDGIRGLTLCNMIVYHAIWDLVYLFDFDWKWYHTSGSYVWQQCICWTFIILSGFCQALGNRSWKRGLTVFLSGFSISMVSWGTMPGNRIRFGVLTLIGSCMLLMIPMECILKRCKPAVGLICSMSLFFLTRNINSGYLGFGRLNLTALPEALYRNATTAYLGFPMAGFSSTDYFSLFPWIFLFAAGYFLCRLFCEKELLSHLTPSRITTAEWVGRHSLGFYLLHQPVLYALFTILLH